MLQFILALARVAVLKSHEKSHLLRSVYDVCMCLSCSITLFSVICIFVFISKAFCWTHCIHTPQHLMPQHYEYIKTRRILGILCSGNKLTYSISWNKHNKTLNTATYVHKTLHCTACYILNIRLDYTYRIYRCSTNCSYAFFKSGKKYSL